MSRWPRPQLPDRLRGELTALGERRAENPKTQLVSALAGLAALPSDRAVAWSSEIAVTAKLHYGHKTRGDVLSRLIGRRLTDAELLALDPAYAWLFIFHGDGHLREAALNRIDEAPRSAFFFMVLNWRLNDWVPEVRAAASRCAERVFPITPATIIAEAAAVLLRRKLSWGRWESEAAVVDAAIGRADVAVALADHLCDAKGGPAGSVLMAAGALPAIDQHLARLARRAVQPSVRAVALEALVSEEARWPIGYAYVWVDKAYGLRKHVPEFATRPLTSEASPGEYAAVGLRDRSKIVRRRMADLVVKHRRSFRDLGPLIDAMAEDPQLEARLDFLKSD